MESASSWLHQSFHGSWIFVLFLPLIIIIVVILHVLHLLRLRFWCTCHICQSYIESRWAVQFPNLCDWYAHLLRNSPTRTIHIHVLNNTITANPDNVEYMLKTRFDNFPKGKPFSASWVISWAGEYSTSMVIPGDFSGKWPVLKLGRVSIRLLHSKSSIKKSIAG
ncbi:UNVERIFIED_CONTAM: cytochrome [Sesamum latifolium]|uniref:Cytochrome n=1 Tax=Sesamum latifolium TaxID=2727402 RepID=A0AAW2VAM8_9LAMI